MKHKVLTVYADGSHRLEVRDAPPRGEIVLVDGRWIGRSTLAANHDPGDEDVQR